MEFARFESVFVISARFLSVFVISARFLSVFTISARFLSVFTISARFRSFGSTLITRSTGVLCFNVLRLEYRSLLPYISFRRFIIVGRVLKT